MFNDSLKKFINTYGKFYVINDYCHAFTILKSDFQNEYKNLIDLLDNFKIKKEWIEEGGGGKTKIAKNIETHFNNRGWKEQKFKVSYRVNDKETISETNKIDCFKNKIGLEIQWNNKTEFYDRDLNTFKRLHELKQMDVGIMITRDRNLDTTVKKRFAKKVAKKYGPSSTIYEKFINKINQGSAGSVPILTLAFKGAIIEK